MTSGKPGNPFAHGGNLAEVRERYALGDRPLLDFSANINPLGMPESVRKAILANMEALLHYPDTECRRLRKRLSERLGVAPANVIVGNGSTELMFLVVRAFSPEAVCIVDPTFTEYRHAAEHAGSKCISVCSESGWDFSVTGDLLERAAKSAQMVFLCNPNNPTGGVLAGAEALTVASRHPETLFVIDEAFCDFLSNEGEVSVAREAAGVRNVIVLRSLTKFYAIPGLRVGYLTAHEERIGRMLGVKEPWTVNALAEAAGCAAMEDVHFAKESVARVAAWKGPLAEALGRIKGIRTFPPSANFVFGQITRGQGSVEDLQERLMARGILIRNCANFPGLDSTYFRVAVRTPEENARLVEAMTDAMEGT